MVDFIFDLNKQDYNENKDIDFIDIFPLKRSSDETGTFTELIRLSNGNFSTNAVECLNISKDSGESSALIVSPLIFKASAV